MSNNESIEWSECLKELEKIISIEDFDYFIKPLSVDVEGLNLVIKSPNRHIDNQIKNKFLKKIEETVLYLNPNVSVVFKQSSAPVALSISDKNIKYKTPDSTLKKVDFNGSKIKFKLDKIRIDSTLSFKNFVIGSTNELAYTAAKKVASTGCIAGNPLLIYGPSGVGKTHLLHAIASGIKEKKPELNLALITSEIYYRQMVRSIKDNTIEHFKDYFRGLDLLLIDDIQFFAGKERTQDEMSYTYNYLMNHNKQIVLTSDRYPKEIPKLEERLQTRFSSGLPIMVEPPEFETRFIILQKKAKLYKDKNVYTATLPDDCAELIAQKLKSNVRELEGALKVVLVYAELRGAKIDVPLVNVALKDIFEQKEKSISIGNIQQIVAEYYGIKVNDLMSKSRLQNIALPRHMAIFLIKQLTKHSLVEIGRSFGNRDHATILHSLKKIEKLKKELSSIETDYKNLYRRLTS